MDWLMILLYVGVVLCALLLIYYILAAVNISAKRRNARLLRELLEATRWGDVMEMIKNPEYVQAVIKGCEIVLEG